MRILWCRAIHGGPAELIAWANILSGPAFLTRDTESDHKLENDAAWHMTRARLTEAIGLFADRMHSFAKGLNTLTKELADKFDGTLLKLADIDHDHKTGMMSSVTMKFNGSSGLVCDLPKPELMERARVDARAAKEFILSRIKALGLEPFWTTDAKVNFILRHYEREAQPVRPIPVEAPINID